MFVSSLAQGHPASDTNTNTGLYITDERFPGHYREHVVKENPAVTSNKNYLTGYTNSHFQPNVNALKTVELSIVTSGFSSNATSWYAGEWGAWRNWFGKNSSMAVHPSVQLHLDTNIIEMGYEYEFDNLWEKVMGNKLVSTIDQAASNARMFADAVGNHDSAQAGLMISKYRNIPVLKGVSSLNLPSSLKFEFSFGSAGIFSGEEEVVKPILVLARALAPTLSYNSKTGKYDGNFVIGNAPSNEYALAKVVQGIWQNLTGAKSQEDVKNMTKDQINNKFMVGDNDDIKEEMASATGGNFVRNSDKTETTSMVETVSTAVAQKLTQLQNAIHDAFDSAAKELLETHDAFKGVRLRIGRLALPAMIVKKVNFNFDFEKIDEYGFPYKGTLTLDGLETATVATSGSLGWLE